MPRSRGGQQSQSIGAHAIHQRGCFTIADERIIFDFDAIDLLQKRLEPVFKGGQTHVLNLYRICAVGIVFARLKQPFILKNMFSAWMR